MAEIERSIERERMIHEKGGDGWLDCFRGFRKDRTRALEGEKARAAVVNGTGATEMETDGGMVGYRTLLGMSLQSLQQLTGANYL